MQSSLPYFGELGSALRLARDRAKVTAAAVAQKAGIGKSQLSKYETGRELPKMDTLAKIIDVLGVEPLWLFYVMHLLSRGNQADPLRIELALLGGCTAASFSQDEADAFKRVLDSLLDLHTLVVAQRILV